MTPSEDHRPFATKAALAALLALLALPAAAAEENDIVFEGRCASFGLRGGAGSGLVMLPVRNDRDEALDLAFDINWLADPADDATMGAPAPGYADVAIQPGALRLASGAKEGLRVSLAVSPDAPETFVAAFRIVATSGERTWTGPLVVLRDPGFRGPDPYCNGPIDPHARVTHTPVAASREPSPESMVVTTEATPVQPATADAQPDDVLPASTGGVVLATLGGAGLVLAWRRRA